MGKATTPTTSTLAAVVISFEKRITAGKNGIRKPESLSQFNLPSPSSSNAAIKPGRAVIVYPKIITVLRNQDVAAGRRRQRHGKYIMKVVGEYYDGIHLVYFRLSDGRYRIFSV